MFDEESDTISLDEDLEPLMITGDLDAVEPTRPLERPETAGDSVPFVIVDEDIYLNRRAATNADWPPTPKIPARARRHVGVYRATTQF